MLRTPEAFLKEGSKVFRLAPADKRVIRSLIQAAQSKAKDVEVKAVSLDTRIEAAYDGMALTLASFWVTMLAHVRACALAW